MLVRFQRLRYVAMLDDLRLYLFRISSLNITGVTSSTHILMREGLGENTQGPRAEEEFVPSSSF
jgi:hypothetical protein